jgi:hypothetical protein
MAKLTGVNNPNTNIIHFIFKLASFSLNGYEDL